ncbi:acyltransferase family protein [Sphingomonas sp. ID0503]|uniref:acyltransferase family protein n=1 Tax=Sphingomonas sp. ID0503 TaxID=3399691 RepID=UPI003AFAEB34
MAARQIETHTALRGVAALMVVAYHLQFGAGYRLPLETVTPFWERGYLLVDLFFVLSGFVISYANDADRARPFTAGEYGRFLMMRIARIYPLHLACLLALAAFGVVVGAGMELLRNHSVPMPGAWSDFLIQLALLNAWFGGEGWNVPSWSISAEMFAYLVFPLIVSLRARSGAVTIAALLSLAAVFYLWIAATTGSLDIVVGLAPLRCLAGFVLGMCLFYGREGIARLGEPVLSILQLAALALLLLTLALGWNDVAAVPAFAVLVGATWTDRGVLARALVGRVSLFLGKISYSIYLTHLVVLYVFSWRRIDSLAAINPPLIRTLYLIGAFGVVILVSTLTFRYVEVPARQWLSRRILHRRARPIEQAPPAP